MFHFSVWFILTVHLCHCNTFLAPKHKFLQLPYGNSVRGQLSVLGKIPILEKVSDDLQWWHSLSRNNSINCECGAYTKSNKTDRWKEEGLESLNVYPWSVSLVAPGTKYAFCGGSLVNDRYVLTSATCVDGSVPDGIEVLVGSWPAAHFLANETDPDDLKGKTLFRKKIHRIIIHPKYLDKHLDYNIALLRLHGPVPTFGTKGGVSPVCLPAAETSFDDQDTSSLLWRFHQSEGRIFPVRRTEIESRVLSMKECRDLEYNNQWSQMPDTMMCARFKMPSVENHPYNKSYDCPGDAGGFLLASRAHQKIQVGIDSWTACYGKPDGIGIYTRVSAFLPWLNLHISEDGRKCSN